MNNQNILKELLTESEYKNHLRNCVIEALFNEDLNRAREALNELSVLSN